MAAAAFLQSGGTSWWANVCSPWAMLPFTDVPHCHILPSDGNNSNKLPSKEKIFAWMQTGCLFWKLWNMERFFQLFFFFNLFCFFLWNQVHFVAFLTWRLVWHVNTVKRAHQHVLLQSDCLDGTARSLLSDCKLSWEVFTKPSRVICLGLGHLQKMSTSWEQSPNTWI